MSSLLTALLLVAPVLGEWSCPEPEPPPPRVVEVNGKPLMMMLEGRYGESPSGAYYETLWSACPVEDSPHASLAWTLVTRLVGEDRRLQLEELRSESRAWLPEDAVPPPDEAAEAMAAAMLACAEQHGRHALPAVQAWANAQDEVEPAAVLAQLAVVDTPGVTRGQKQRAAIQAAHDSEALERLAWRFLQLGQREAASRTWVEAADREPLSPWLPQWLARAVAAVPEPRGRRLLLERLAEALAPGSDWSEAQTRRVRRAHEPLRADVELELALTWTPGGELTSRSEALQAWLGGHPRHPLDERVRWLAVAALVSEGREDEALESLDRYGPARDPREALLLVAARARQVEGRGESPELAERGLLEAVRALQEVPLTDPAQRAVAVEAGLAAALVGYAAARERGDAVLEHTWWTLIASGELLEHRHGEAWTPEALTGPVVWLIRRAQQATEALEEPQAPPPSFDVPALLVDLEERWAGLAAEGRPALVAFREAETREEKRIAWALAVQEYAHHLHRAQRLGLRQLLASEVLLAAEGFEELSAGRCSTGLAWEHLASLDLAGPTQPRVAIDLSFGRSMLEEHFYEPARSLAQHHLAACHDLAVEAERWSSWQDRAEQALYRLDPGSHPNPDHVERRGEPGLLVPPAVVE